jgi:two-component system response regulator PilR (NtrC family)
MNENLTVESPRAVGPTPAARILVVDDEPSMREMLNILLRREGYDVTIAENGTIAIDLLQREFFDMLISDIKMPDISGVEVLRKAKEINPAIIGIMVTAYGSKESIQEVLRLQAADYIDKPFNVEELKFRIRKELRFRQTEQENVLLKRERNVAHKFLNIVGSSGPMLALFQLVETIAPTTTTVLITGESGTGKELVARAIHARSARRDRPFVALNCGALPETLLDSELFGHMRGAFTGADTNKKGLIEVADKGTVFLDEIGEMSPMVQVKLLRFLQERKFRRLGGTDEIDADIRVIAATNRDLSKMVAEGGFREDLFYRINVIPVRLPPLRERPEDVPLLAEHFVVKYAAQMKKDITSLSGSALACLRRYAWPGNVRELENAIERAVALERSSAILPDSLPEQLQQPASPGLQSAGRPGTRSLDGNGAGREGFPEEGIDLEQHVQHIEREYIAEALRRAGGVKVKAAELLGMSFRSFRYYTKKYNLK